MTAPRVDWIVLRRDDDGFIIQFPNGDSFRKGTEATCLMLKLNGVLEPERFMDYVWNFRAAKVDLWRQEVFEQLTTEQASICLLM